MLAISKYLRRNLLTTCLISTALTFVICQIFNSDVITLEKTQGDAIEATVLIVWTIVLTITAATVFFNRIKAVRDNIVLCTLSFFLLPLLSTFLCWFSNRQGTGWTLFFISTAIFFLTHFIFYIKFVRRMKAKFT